MDDDLMWAADHVVAPTPSSAITIPETITEFAIKDAEYKELQSRAIQPTHDLDDDDMPMSREEEAKFIQTFASKIPFILDDLFFTLLMQLFELNRNNSILDIDVIDEILKEDFNALLDEGSKILHSIKGTLLEEEIFAEFDEFME
nr:reverse transcriptase domain-containing protein [Tanacetum cinerariifolium]